mgnify:CR=1 FL=1
MKTFTRFFLKNKALSWLLLILIILGGIFSYYTMGKLEDAPFTIKQALITTTYPGASPAEASQWWKAVAKRNTDAKRSRAFLWGVMPKTR